MDKKANQHEYNEDGDYDPSQGQQNKENYSAAIQLGQSRKCEFFFLFLEFLPIFRILVEEIKANPVIKSKLQWWVQKKL